MLKFATDGVLHRIMAADVHLLKCALLVTLAWVEKQNVVNEKWQAFHAVDLKNSGTSFGCMRKSLNLCLLTCAATLLNTPREGVHESTDIMR